MKRSQSTTAPLSSAGRMTSSTWSLRAAAHRMASMRTPNSSAAPDKSTCRTASAPGEPPGSRVTSTSWPARRSESARRLIWVDLPAPSPPSNVTNNPDRPAKPPTLFIFLPSGIRSPALPAHAPVYRMSGGGETPWASKPEEHQFQKRIRRLRRKAAGADRRGGQERNLAYHPVARKQAQGGDLLPLRDRCPQRPAIDDAAGQARWIVGGHVDIHRFRRDKLHRTHRAAVDARLGDRLA